MSQVVYTFCANNYTFTLVTEEYELCYGKASTDIEKFQRQSEDDRCLLVGTEGYGRQTY